jgi:DNA repair exonuclease SbcCD ATPase subunit
MSLTTADVQAARSRLDELDAAQVAAAAVAAAAPSPAASAKPFVTDALDTLGVLLRDNANKVAAIAAQVVADVTAQQSHHLRQLEEFAAEREALRRSLDEARARVVKAQIETQCESLRARETAAAEHLVAERKRLTEQSHSQFAAVLTSLTSPVRS